MNAARKKDMKSLAHAYWQPLVLAVLLLLILFQAYGWAMKFADFQKVDSLIAHAKEVDSVENEKKEDQKPGPPKPSSDKPAEPQKPETNIFRKERTNYSLSAIYMDKAIINGQEVKEGGRVGKATVKEIRIFEVIIQEEDKENTQTLTLFQNVSGKSNGPSSSSHRSSRPKTRSSRKSGRFHSTGSGGSGPPPQATNQGGMRRGGMGNAGSMRERIMNMSPRERQELKEKVMSMPPEQRRQYIRKIREGR
ncbi:hypothetical protein GF373_03050 [bacterium]|nr:hypothetical protein [bacterium]